MQRFVFAMKLKPGFEAEYKHRHDEIWPELAREIREAGISDYSIYLAPDSLTLFAVQKLNPDHTAGELPESPVVKKWWAYMADIMDTNPDNLPVTRELPEVFHLD
ncbi:MAG: L-rhamnose mutarotase [Spirochaetaceae bacterium]|nr:L-rhamnose mutarotase [Spirochaetaceae bacterium]